MLNHLQHDLAVHTDSNSHLAPSLRLEPSATFSVANSTRGTHFIFGPVASAAAVSALRLAQIQTQAQITLQQLASLAAVTVDHHFYNRFAATLLPHLALLRLLDRRELSTVGYNVNTNNKTHRVTRPCFPAAMYHHHSQQQGQQPFSNGPQPPHPQPPTNQPQNRNPSDMLSQVLGFQFPRPTQLPDELESALAIRGARDMDHRLIDHMNQPNQNQNQGSGSGLSYSSSPIALTSDNQPAHQQGVDWSSYQPPAKLFAGSAPSASHHQGPQQQPQGSHAGTSIPSWTTPVSDSPSSQARHPHGGAGGGGGSSSGDGQGLYTPESAGSILASFGLSNEDLEVLSHYPDDQLTPDTLPFILRDIQINKSSSQKKVASTSSFSTPLASSRSPEVPSLLTVTQTAGKVIDYGHASRAKDESGTRETFKREPLSSERTVKMYPSSSSSSSAPNVDKTERRQVNLEHNEPSKHGDRDYRRTSSDHRKSSRSPGREFPPSAKSRNLDRDYRRDGPKPKPSSETKSEDSSRLSSSSGSKPVNSSKKCPTPTMISDFSAVSPKVYPHTCSLCHIECDQEKDWVEHINTVSHTAACRDLRNKYPGWKPNLPSRSGRYGSRALWDPRDLSPSHSVSRSLSHSLSPSPPRSKHKWAPHPYRPHGRPYSPHRYPRHHYTGHRLDRHHSGSRSPPHSHQSSSSIRDHRPERRDRAQSGDSRTGVKRQRDDSTKYSTDVHRFPSSSRHGPPQSSSRPVKSWSKPGAKTAKPPPAKKKKKMPGQASQDWSFAERLVYLTGIPNDASEQEVTDLVGSFGKINNVILMPCSEEDDEKSEGQKASVCMMKAEDAEALANSTNLSIREQHITASVAKKPEGGQSPDASSSKPAPGAAREESGGDAEQKTSDEKAMLLISGLPEVGCSESDIISLIQPFGTPSDIVMATQLRKVLVSVPDTETAEEIVKVHTFVPAKIGDAEVKMIHLKHRIGLSTPVALYNLLMAPVDPLENPSPVGWSSLLVISNVPNTASASTEVQKLVRRFGTVIKTLVLNNMVICKMATAAMAMSVYKRFQTFPCIIQNNPLFFSRKPDPKASTQTKVIAAYLDPSEVTTANGKASQPTEGGDEEETVHKENSDSHVEEMEKDATIKEEKLLDEDEALGENQSNNEGIKKEELTSLVSDSLLAPASSPHNKPEADEDSDVKDTSAVETVMEASEENKEVISSEGGNEQTPGGEATKLCSSEGKASSSETVIPELPKVTQEMVNALLVECRTWMGSRPNNTAASACGEPQDAQMEEEQSKTGAEETKEPEKNHTEEEMERKERQARKDKEARERREERRAWEKEERAKRERERDERARRERERREEERREWERRERERRERKRAYGEGSRASFRYQGYKHSSWRDEHYSSSKAEMKVEEEEEFSFNMSDFVTVDEVGDVTDLPGSPSAAPMETTEGEEDTPTSVQPDASGDTPTEVTTETASDATETEVKPGEQVSECEAVNVPTAETSDALDLSPAVDCCHSQPHVPTPETDVTPLTESTLPATVDSDNPPEAGSSHSPGTVVVTSDDKEEEKQDDAVGQSQTVEEKLVSDKSGVQDEETKEAAVPAADTGDPENREEESVKKLEIETSLSTEHILPPFDPSNPVGMEFLVPKTGFFCKVCNRFFSGNKEAEINHCKTAKHYENLQKYLQTTKTAHVAAKSESS